MKRAVWIASGIILTMVLFFGIKIWKENQAIKRETERIPELWHILTFAESRGADWATDELMINNIDSFRKKSLYRKWGEPSESAETANEDIWILSDQFQLIVDYNAYGRAEKMKVVPST